MIFFFLFYFVTMIGSKVFGMLRVFGPGENFLRSFLLKQKDFCLSTPISEME